MNLYKMELQKILKRKLTWVTGGVLLLCMAVLTFLEGSRFESVTAVWGSLSGLRRFLELAEFFEMFVFVWIIVILASFFCEDRQYHTDVFFATTANGKLVDFAARLLVAFSLTIGACIIAVLWAFCSCAMIYGYSGMDAMVGEIYFGVMDSSPLASKSIISFIGSYFVMAVFAMIMLDALIVWISTISKKALHSLITIFGVYLLPAVLESVFRDGTMNVGYIIVTGQPILLTVIRCMRESWPVYGWHIFIACTAAVIGIWRGAGKWAQK